MTNRYTENNDIKLMWPPKHTEEAALPALCTSRTMTKIAADLHCRMLFTSLINYQTGGTLDYKTRLPGFVLAVPTCH